MKSQHTLTLAALFLGLLACNNETPQQTPQQTTDNNSTSTVKNEPILNETKASPGNEEVEKQHKLKDGDTLTIFGTLERIQESDFWGRFYVTIKTEEGTQTIDYYTEDVSFKSKNEKSIGEKVEVLMEVEIVLEEQDLFINDKSIHGEYSRYKDINVDISEDADIKGTLLVNEYDLSGDLPSSYRILTKSGDTVEVTAFVHEGYLKYTNETVAVFTSEKTHLVSRNIQFESSDAPSQFSFVGQWVRKDLSNPVGPREFTIEKEGDGSYYVIMNDNYYSFEISDNLSELNGSGSQGATTIKVSSNEPTTLSYSDDGRGGHFDPIKDMLFVKKSE